MFFFEPSTPGTAATTLTEVLGWLREISIIGVIVGFAWKARGFYDDAQIFLNRIETHMTKMEEFAENVVENHMIHLQESLDKIADKNE